MTRIVMGSSDWNVEQVARVGETFKYGANGSEGLLGNKKVYIVSSSGGDHREFFNPDTPLFFP
jgi:FMN-dependent NADH-azoreductase